MKVLIVGFVLYLSVNFCSATNQEEDELLGSDWKPFNKPEIEHKPEASDCKCPKYPRPVDCSEVKENGNDESGEYTIYPRNRGSTCGTIQVLCDMETDGGGWTVIQRRGDYGNGQNYFNKKFRTYKNGFGSLKKEFWLGNDNIHALTNQASYAVRFDLRKVSGDTAFALYDSFWIENEEKKYKLHIEDYSGTAGDALSLHEGKEFETHDKRGGWWPHNFPSSNLNGLNKQGQDKQNEKNGITWDPFGGYLESLAATEIKVRPNRYSG